MQDIKASMSITLINKDVYEYIYSILSFTKLLRYSDKFLLAL